MTLPSRANVLLAKSAFEIYRPDNGLSVPVTRQETLSSTFLKKVRESPVASAEKIDLTYSADTIVSCDDRRDICRSRCGYDFGLKGVLPDACNY